MEDTTFTQRQLHHTGGGCAPQELSLGTFNIRNIRGSKPAKAIQAVQIGGFDPMILTETNITYQDYCCNRLRYDVVYSTMITKADGGTHGGVGLGMWELPQGLNLYSTRFHGENMVSCEFVTGKN